MTWDMLRGMVGDEAFVRGMQRFYRDNRFRRASFDDIRVAFEAVSERKLGGFFDQWVLRTGAPELALGAVACRASGRSPSTDVYPDPDSSAGAAYVLQVPIAVYSAKAVRSEKVEMTQKSQTFSLDLAEAPLRLEVDPQFNLFRTLHYAEIPPSMSKAFGADKVILVLPSDAPAAEAQRYRKLADIWTKDATRDIKVVGDKELLALPADRSVWILGWNNRWRHVVDKAVAGYQGQIDDRKARLGRAEFARAENSVVVAVRHPENPRLAAVWLSVPELAAVEGTGQEVAALRQVQLSGLHRQRANQHRQGRVAGGRLAVGEVAVERPGGRLGRAGQAAGVGATRPSLPQRSHAGACAPTCRRRDARARTGQQGTGSGG